MSDTTTELVSALYDRMGDPSSEDADAVTEYIGEAIHGGFDGWDEGEQGVIKELFADIERFIRHRG